MAFKNYSEHISWDWLPVQKLTGQSENASGKKTIYFHKKHSAVKSKIHESTRKSTPHRFSGDISSAPLVRFEYI
jgi:hypothetical protein